MIANDTVQIPLLPILIAAPVLSLAFIISLPWVLHHTDFAYITRRHLHRFAPLYLIAGPSAVTYFTFSGTISAIAVCLFCHVIEDPSRDTIIASGIFTMLKWIEYASSFFGTLAFARIIHWVQLPLIWTVMLVVTMSISAAYRTARNDPGQSFGTGPEVLFSPEWIDTIPVFLGLGIFLFLQRLNPNPKRDTTIL